MMINSLLRIKYGLVHDPSDDVVRQWHTHYLMFCANGLDSEKAGYESAKNEFVDFEKVNYQSCSDTIDAVLEVSLNQYSLRFDGVSRHAPIIEGERPTSKAEQSAEQG